MLTMQAATFVAILLTATCSALTCFAQDPGDAGVFADSLGTTTTLDVVVGDPFYVYVVAFDLPELAAYEASIQGLAPGLFPMSSTFLGPAPLIFGDTLNFTAYAGGCVVRDHHYVITALQLVALQEIPADTAILLRAFNPSSFGGLPGYAECDLETLHPFGVATRGTPNYPNGALILNPSSLPGPVADESKSFGEIKSRY